MSRTRKYAAFTLLELLIVIAIIAILAGLTFAVLGSSKQKAKLILCTQNLQTIGAAFTRYAADHSGEFPPAHSESVAEEAFGVWSAAFIADGYITEPEDKAHAVFLCPFDPDAGEAESYSLRSYAYNIPGSDSEPVYPNRVNSLHRTILLAEWWTGDPHFQPQGRPTWSDDGWAWRHSGGLYKHHPDGTSNVLFYDMHIEAVKAVPDLPDPSTNAQWSFDEKDAEKR